MALDRSAGAVVAILAILNAGASYVPLDLSYPVERLRFLASDAKVHLVVAEPDSDLSWLEPSASAVRFAPEALSAELSDSTVADTLPGTLVRPTRSDEAYVIYTSGSTGTPKGCSVSHGNVLSLLSGALLLFDLQSDDRWAMFHSCSFDFSVWEMWGALSTGAAIVVVDKAHAMDPRGLVGLCIEQDVSVLCSVPSVFSGIAPQLESPHKIRYVIFGGEAMRPADVRAVMDRGAEHPRFVNMYGITETTVHVTFKEIGSDDVGLPAHLSPIGVELPHLRVTLVDQHGASVDDGVDGEMLIAGEGVCLGYVDRDELNREKFVIVDGVRMYRSGDLGRRLANGELAYRGRVDDQVKIRGFRIELGEVELTLQRIPSVEDACAVVTQTPAGLSRLEAGVVVRGDFDLAALREFASTVLPPHMVPARFVPLDHIPKLNSGKVDRKAVSHILHLDNGTGDQGTPNRLEETTKGPDAADREDLGSVDLIEEFLVGIWIDVLGHDDFDGDDSFFDAGGDSLRVVAVRDRVLERFPSVEVRVVDLFLHPSIRSLARHLEAARVVGSG